LFIVCGLLFGVWCLVLWTFSDERYNLSQDGGILILDARLDTL